MGGGGGPVAPIAPVKGAGLASMPAGVPAVAVPLVAALPGLVTPCQGSVAVRRAATVALAGALFDLVDRVSSWVFSSVLPVPSHDGRVRDGWPVPPTAACSACGKRVQLLFF